MENPEIQKFKDESLKIIRDNPTHARVDFKYKEKEEIAYIRVTDTKLVRLIRQRH